MLLPCLRVCKSFPKRCRSLCFTSVVASRLGPRNAAVRPVRREQHRQEEEIRRLMDSIEHFMRLTLQRKNFQSFIHKQISHGAKSIDPSRIVAVLENIIGHLVDHNRLREAVSVYHRMKNEGLAPSAPTDADMLAISYALSDTYADPNLLTSLKLNVSSPTFTEAHLKRLLELMHRLHLPGHLIAECIRYFLSSRESPVPSRLLAQLVEFLIKVGQYNSATEIVSEFTTEDVGSAGSRVYGAALDSLVHQEADDNVRSLLQDLENCGSPPDFRVFNALVRLHVRKESWQAAFATYDIMRQTSKMTPVVPHYQTFVMLLHAHEVISKSKTPPPKDSLRPARLLFRDIMSTTFNAKCPRLPGEIVPQQHALLHTAIRTFIAQRDYAAAYVALSSFEKLRVPVTYTLYRFVVSKLAALMTTAAASSDPSKSLQRLTFIFFGLTNLTTEAITVLSNPFKVCRRLLLTASKPELHLKPAPDLKTAISPTWTTNPESPKMYVPTWDVVIGAKGANPALEVDLRVSPLLRLMKRALLSSFGYPRPKITDENEARTWGTRNVSTAIVEAKEVMVPKDQTYFIPAKDNRSWYTRGYLRGARVAHRVDRIPTPTDRPK